MVPAQPCHTVLPGTARSVTAMRGWGQNMRDHISSVAGLNALMPCTPWGVCLIPVMQWLLLFNSSGDHVLNVRHADHVLTSGLLCTWLCMNVKPLASCKGT